MNSNIFRQKTKDTAQIMRFLKMAKEKNLTCEDLELILSTIEFNTPKPALPIRKMLRSVDKLLCGGGNA